MRTVFEDSWQSALSYLFSISYSDTDRAKFVYAGGGDNVINKIKDIFEDEIFKKSDEIVLAFIDVVPDNEHTIDAFNSAIFECKENYAGRVIILPIPCAEYYLIKSIYKYAPSIILDKESVELCINKFDYRNANCLKGLTEEQLEWYNTFERFCKLVRNICFKKCTRNEDVYSKRKYTDKDRNKYFRGDCSNACKCSCADSNCPDEYSLQDKSRNLLSEYPMVPGKTLLKDKRELSKEEIADEIDKLYNDFHKFQEELKDKGYKVSNIELWR